MPPSHFSVYLQVAISYQVFNQRGRKHLWSIWHAFHEKTMSFNSVMMKTTFHDDAGKMSQIEKFMILMYYKMNYFTPVTEA